MKTPKQSYRIVLAVAAITATISVGAHAEYRCKAPPMPEDKVACDLAKLDGPDELRQFIQRTSSIYGLYFYDYVSQQDFDHWDLAREHENTPSIKTADDRVKAEHR